MRNGAELFVAIHESWLKLLFGSFALKNGPFQDRLYDFSEILYRHLRWVEEVCVREGTAYSYEREMLQISARTVGEVARWCDEALEGLQACVGSESALQQRIGQDLEFMRFTLQEEKGSEETVVAFDRNLRYGAEEFDEETLGALLRFLFDESYKEYELVVIYSYAQRQIEDQRIFEIFQILIDESKFHLKSFARMMARLGILSVPRFVTKELYEITDLVAFLKEGIEEELAAKEECRAIAEKINHEGLQRFFDFINYQENYHIALMEEALARCE
jgi:rubrerythrin